MNKPEKLILDYSKWRCGGNGQYKLGEGKVALRNKEGFMCCLGQWHMQLGCDPSSLLGKGEPCELSDETPALSYTEGRDDDKDIYNTPLSNTAIYINDDEDTTPEYKIEKLSELLAIEGIQLEVINKP